MKICSNDYKNAIKRPGRMIKSKITYELNNEEVVLTDDDLFSVTPNFKSNILKSAMKQLDINSTTDIPLNTEINYQFGVKVGNEYEYINFGNYVVYSSEKQEDTNSYRIVCYDKMLYSMKDYESLEVVYPITIRNYISALCTKIGLTFKNANETFVNYDKEITSELYLDSQGNSLGYTFRDVLDELAQVTASIICINEDDDELEIRYVGFEKTAKGTNITINDNADEEPVDLQLLGNTYQETTTGKNLLNYNNANITPESNGTYYLDGTNAGGGGIVLPDYSNLEYYQSNCVIFHFMQPAYYSIPAYDDTYLMFLESSNPIKAQFYGSSDTDTFNNFDTRSSDGHPQNFIKAIYKLDNNSWVLMGTNSYGVPSDVFRGGISGNELTMYKTTVDICLTNMNNYPYVTDWDNPIYSAGYDITGGSTTPTNIKVAITSGLSYAISYDIVNAPVSFNLVDSQDNLIASLPITSGANSYVFTATTNDYAIPRLEINANTNCKINDIMIEQNTQATDYEPYTNGATPNSSYEQPIKIATGTQTINIVSGLNSQSFTIDLGNNELGNIDNIYKDKIYKKNNNWYIRKEIGKKVLNGSENWNIYNDEQTNVRGYYLSVSNEADNVGLCNYFKKYDGDIAPYARLQVNYEAISILQDIIKVAVLKTTASSLNDFKTWLSTHNLIIYYGLETPTETQITDNTLVSQLNAIELYLGTNNIVITTSSNDILPINLYLKYKSNSATFDEDSLKNINVSFSEQYGPINTIVFSRSAGTDKIALSRPTTLSDEDKKAIEIKDNQILNGNNRSDFIEDILDKLYGLEYYLNDFASTGITYLNLGDNYKVKIGEQEYKCILFNDEVDITQGLEEKIYTEKPEDSVNNYKNISNTDRQIQQTTLEVNKQDSRIKAVAKTITLTVSDDGDSAGIVIKAYNEAGEEVSTANGTITLSGLVKFIDLSTSGSTTINGSNITTGTIKSQNYSSDVSGTSINLSDGVIDSKNFKVNSTGDMTANSGYIGGWQISNGHLTATVNNVAVQLDPEYLSVVGAGIDPDNPDRVISTNIPWTLVARAVYIALGLPFPNS